MTEERRALLERVCAERSLPGLILVVARGAGVPEVLCVGVDADGTPLGSETLLPVASVTKLATALAVLRLVGRGALALDDPLSRHAPEAVAANDGVTVRHLLCHTAGLPLDLARDVAPYAAGLDWPHLQRACLAAAAERAPGEYVQYSNVGYGLLAACVERVTGLGFAEALDALVLIPLDIEGYLGVEPPRAPARIADVRGRHAGTDLEPFNSRFWRSLALPWAGLVTSASGALALVGAFHDLHEAIRDQTGGLDGGMAPPLVWRPCPWGLGPELRGTKAPHWAPPTAAPDSFGHAGASGCVAWSDPTAGVAWTLLGTRTADTGWLLRAGPTVGAAVLEG